MNDTAFIFYSLISKYFENDFLKSPESINSYLFSIQNEYTYYFPYYMIIVCERLKKYDIGLKMFNIIFTMKYIDAGEWWANNLIYNFQFFIHEIKNIKDNGYCIINNIFSKKDTLIFKKKINNILIKRIKKNESCGSEFNQCLYNYFYEDLFHLFFQ